MGAWPKISILGLSPTLKKAGGLSLKADNVLIIAYFWGGNDTLPVKEPV